MKEIKISARGMLDALACIIATLGFTGVVVGMSINACRADPPQTPSLDEWLTLFGVFGVAISLFLLGLWLYEKNPTYTVNRKPKIPKATADPRKSQTQ